VILLAALAVVVASVPLAGGRLSRVADVRLRWLPLLYAAVLVQVLLLEVLAPHISTGWARALHLLTYALGAAVVVRNLRVPGIAVIALGGALNLAAIAANGGVMPASPAAMRAAGLTDAASFENSAVVESPRLAFLGDVYAVPESLPLSNVFSLGDVVLVLGAAVLLHGACDTWPARVWSRGWTATRSALRSSPLASSGSTSVAGSTREDPQR
jgi:hypothetical protein